MHKAKMWKQILPKTYSAWLDVPILEMPDLAEQPGVSVGVTLAVCK